MAKDESNDRPKIVVDRKKEMRTKDTSKMIDEGGLGSRTHYDIEKVSSPDQEIDTNGNENNKE